METRNQTSATRPYETGLRTLSRRLLVSAALLLGLIGPILLGTSTALAAVDVLGPVCDNTTTADDPATVDSDAPAICKDRTAPGQDPLVGPNGVLTQTIFILGLIVGVAAIIVIIISSLQFILAAGDANTVSGARRTLLFAVVGLMVAAVSQFIVAFVLKKI